MNTQSDRRRFLKFGAGAAGGLLFSSPITQALAAQCGLTPPQTSGPFYPGEKNFTPENDLTRVPGSFVSAQGQVVYIRGRILDPECRPVEGANVEIWQACASGKYNSRKDPNPAPLDPLFRYWGETFTNAEGEYEFKTIIPGAYPADDAWDRPPHIHFRVARKGYRELITQMYFKDHPLNGDDLILREIPAAERESVIVEFLPSGPELEPDTLIGSFDITIRSLR